MNELHLVPAEEFHYTNQGSSIEIPGVNDKEDFTLLKHSLYWLGFSANQSHSFFKVLAAILHLGNVSINCQKGLRHEDASYINSNGEEIVLASKLLGVCVDNLCKWLCNKKIVTKHETLIKSFNVSQVHSSHTHTHTHTHTHYTHTLHTHYTHITHYTHTHAKYYSFVFFSCRLRMLETAFQSICMHDCLIGS